MFEKYEEYKGGRLRRRFGEKGDAEGLPGSALRGEREGGREEKG